MANGEGPFEAHPGAHGKLKDHAGQPLRSEAREGAYSHPMGCS